MAYRILIADDDLHTRRILETLLQREPALGGPDILGVADGQEALASFTQRPFDLVITDLLMPRLDGFSLSRSLRQLPTGKQVPILVTSAVYKDRAALGRLEQEVGCEFFAKPFQLRELIRAVLRLLVEPHRPRAPGRVQGTGGRVDLPQSGLLAERNPARLLFDLLDSSSTGVLTLSRAKVKKEVYILLGHPIGAESNLRNETLGQILLARGAIDPAQLSEAFALSRDSGDRLGAILVERGWMKEADVLKYLGLQVRMKLTSTLRWRDGNFAFAPGDSFSGRITNLTVDVPQLVFAGLKASAAPDEIARDAAQASAALPSRSGVTRLVLAARFERHRDSFVRVFGGDGLVLLGDKPRPGDIAARNDVGLLVQYDALLVSAMATLSVEESAGLASTPAVAPPRLSTPATGIGVAVSGPGNPAPIAPVSKEGSGKTAARGEVAEGKSEALYSELFGEVDQALPQRPPAVDLATSEDSGVFMLPPPPNRRPETDPNVAAARDALLREYLSIPGQDHYQVLQVQRDASANEIKLAFERRAREFQLERFQSVDLGVDHAKLEALNDVVRQAYETLSAPPLRHDYDQALSASSTTAAAAANRPVVAAAPGTAALPVTIEGEADFRDGLRLLGADRPADAARKLKEAVRAAPDQADYQALYGWAQFQAGRAQGRPAAAATAAWSALEQAFAIDPDNVAANEFAGRIAFVLGDDARAARHLERALQLDPTRTEALATLEAVHLRQGEHARLARVYRGLIEKLGNARGSNLWWELGVLLRDHLGDTNAAREAFTTYQRLVPDDARAKEALGKLGERARSTQKEIDTRRTAATLRAAWRASPTDPTPGRLLFKHFADAGMPDAALAAASALIARSAGDAEVEAYAKRYRPRFLQRAIAPIAWAHVDGIRHADDDRDLAALFTRLFAAARPAIADPLPDQPRLGPEALPPTFVQVLGYATWMLGVAPPLVVRNIASPEAAVEPPRPAASSLQLVPLDPPVLVATPETLGLTDKVALAFRLGRALAGLYPARALAAALPSRQLKLYLTAAMALDSGMRISMLDDEVLRLRDRFLSVPMLPQDVRPLVERVASRGGTINLSRWVRGIARTAERVGLLICNDVTVAARVLAEEGAGAAANDLIDFSLSEDLNAVRAALGLSVAV